MKRGVPLVVYVINSSKGSVWRSAVCDFCFVIGKGREGEGEGRVGIRGRKKRVYTSDIICGKLINRKAFRGQPGISCYLQHLSTIGCILHCNLINWGTTSEKKEYK